MPRQGLKLQPRYDTAFYLLGCEIEELKLDEIRNEHIIIPLFHAGGILDIFELVSIKRRNDKPFIYFRDESTLLNVCKHFEGIFGENDLKRAASLFVVPEYFSNPNHIKILKYKEHEIKVYSPIQFLDAEKYKNEWFDILSVKQQKRQRK